MGRIAAVFKGAGGRDSRWTGWTRAGEVSSGHEQKYEEVEEESDLPDR